MTLPQSRVEISISMGAVAYAGYCEALRLSNPELILLPWDEITLEERVAWFTAAVAILMGIGGQN